MLPVKILHRFHKWEVAPVHTFRVPHGDWPKDSGNAISEETDGDCGKDNRCRAERKVIEKLLGCECYRNATVISTGIGTQDNDSVFLQLEGTRIQETDEFDPERKLSFATSSLPSGLELSSTGQKSGPSVTDEV